MNNSLKFLWIIISASNAICIETENEDVYFKFNSFEAILMILSTHLTLNGIKNHKPLQLIPWLLFSLCNIYYDKYFTLELITYFFYYEILGTCAIFITFFTLGFKLYMWTKILTLFFKDFKTQYLHCKCGWNLKQLGQQKQKR